MLTYLKGMSCAETLAEHPERFDVTLIEAQDYCGGQAFSIPIEKERYGAEWLNQGVQGCVRFTLNVAVLTLRPA